MLVNCVVYREGKKIADAVAPQKIRHYLDQPGCFVWVALNEPEPAELAQMEKEFGLHELAVEDVRLGHHRPKIEEYADALFVVLHTVECAADELKVGEVNIFAGPNYVLSLRYRTERGFADVRARCEREPHLLRHGSGFILYALMDTVVDRYFPVVEALEDELEDLERRIFAGSTGRHTIEALYGLKQKITVLKHASSPLMESVGKLYGGRVPQVCANTQEYYRDIYDHLVRINQTIDSLRDTLATAISVNLSL
ncbi:MAG: magnesium and cobalt transport protein CorA, partial [Pseudomonas sp.]